MKRMIVGLLSVCLLGSLTVLADEKCTAEKSVKAESEVVLQDITVTGKLAKHEKGYTVTEADGTVVKVKTPKAAKEGEAAVVDLEKFVGKNVKVVGKGATHTCKDSKAKMAHIKTVTSIEEAAAPAAPAAPEAAPEAK